MRLSLFYTLGVIKGHSAKSEIEVGTDEVSWGSDTAKKQWTVKRENK